MSSRILKPAGIFILILILSGVIGFRVSHPHDGLRNALGSAQSGLVIYRSADIVSVGQTVMIDVDKSDKSPMLVTVTAVDGQKIQVQNGSATLESDLAQVKGKMFAVVPFLGQLLSLVGL